MHFTNILVPLAAFSVALASPMVTPKRAESTISCSDGSSVEIRPFQISSLAETHAAFTNNTKFLLDESNTNTQFYCEGISVVDGKSFDCYARDRNVTTTKASFAYSQDLAVLNTEVTWDAGALCNGSPVVRANATIEVPETSCSAIPRCGGEACFANNFDVPISQISAVA